MPDSAVSDVSDASNSSGGGAAKVHYLELLPHEFRARMAKQPVGYLPLGTLEWHGEHNPLGSDAIISAGLFERAARRFGGIVFPPLFLGPDRIRLQPDGSSLQGMDYADVTTPPRQLDGSCYRIGEGLFLTLCESVLEQAKRAGFQAMVADGHGPSRWAFGRAADGWEQQFGLKLVSVARDFKEGWRSQMDHAALNETSLVMALRPSLVNLSRLSLDRTVWPQGVGGKDPRDASAEHGEECLATCLDLLGAKLAELGFASSG
jgi:creatinine amidohydrolase